MTIARIISIGIVVMLAMSATFDSVNAASPCCTIKNGVWVVTKTGRPASPTQVRTMEKSQATSSPKAGSTMGSSNTAPVGGSAEHGGGGGGHK